MSSTQLGRAESSWGLEWSCSGVVGGWVGRVRRGGRSLLAVAFQGPSALPQGVQGPGSTWDDWGWGFLPVPVQVCVGM